MSMHSPLRRILNKIYGDEISFHSPTIKALIVQDFVFIDRLLSQRNQKSFAVHGCLFYKRSEFWKSSANTMEEDERITLLSLLQDNM